VSEGVGSRVSATAGGGIFLPSTPPQKASILNNVPDSPATDRRRFCRACTCMSTSGRIHSEFLRLLYFIADKQASDYVILQRAHVPILFVYVTIECLFSDF